jgi:cell division protein FtsW
VYSAGSELSSRLFDNPHKMFLGQLMRAALGVLLLVITANVPFRVWEKLAIPGVIVAGMFLMMLMVSGFAVEAKGAARWLRLGPISFQPSEIARYAVILFIASWAYRKGQLMDRITVGVGVPLGIATVLAAMIVLQPDYSTAALLVVSAMVMLFIAGVRIEHLVMVIAPTGLIGFMAIWFSDYRRARLLSFLNPESDANGGTYQILQSSIGLGRGGLFGVGLGGSRQKLFFLPDAHADFIYAIVGEEWGLIGTTALLALFLVLIVRGFRVATRCPDAFGSYLAAGITFSVGLYALANMGIAVGLLPSTGLPLPLISYGGTSLMLTLASLGIVLNISRYETVRKPAAHTGRTR